VVRPDATGPGATGPDATMLGAAVLGAAIATASPTSTTGAAFLDALALGIEAQLRIATAMRPWHDDAGWHLTGTVGPIGAAVTAGLLGGLTDVQLGQAVSIATSLTLGHREGFGTMVEPFHAGKAAANGVLAARLAARGFTGSPTAIEGPRGYLRVLAERSAPELIGQDLGRRWELLTGTARPRTDAELDDMVTQLVEPVWPGHAATLIATVRSVATAPSCHELLRILTKEPS
jgi:2-methylcitrate dehydratase PrpD